jgi:hypothetical protein
MFVAHPFLYDAERLSKNAILDHPRHEVATEAYPRYLTLRAIRFRFK